MKEEIEGEKGESQRLSKSRHLPLETLPEITRCQVISPPSTQQARTKTGGPRGFFGGILGDSGGFWRILQVEDKVLHLEPDLKDSPYLPDNLCRGTMAMIALIQGPDHSQPDSTPACLFGCVYFWQHL